MNEKKEYVKATSDVFIKYMFGMDTKQSNHLVLSFINSVLGDSGYPTITKVIQKNPYNYKEFIDDKESILDIKIEDENHKLYNVEMQSWTRLLALAFAMQMQQERHTFATELCTTGQNSTHHRLKRVWITKRYSRPSE